MNSRGLHSHTDSQQSVYMCCPHTSSCVQLNHNSLGWMSHTIPQSYIYGVLRQIWILTKTAANALSHLDTQSLHWHDPIMTNTPAMPKDDIILIKVFLRTSKYVRYYKKTRREIGTWKCLMKSQYHWQNTVYCLLKLLWRIPKWDNISKIMFFIEHSK